MSLVKSTVLGSFSAQMTEGQQELAKVITSAVHQAGALLKNAWRAQIVGAGLSSRLGNTVQSTNYPRYEDSMSAAAVVAVKGKTPNFVLSELESGAVINTARGRFLAIPTQNVPLGPRGVRLRPEALEVLNGFKLRFAQNRQGTKMLVADAVTARSGRGVRPATRGRVSRGRKASTVVFYILVPQVTIKKRLNLMADADRIGDEMGQLIAERLS